MPNGIDRDLGRHEAQIEQLQKDMTEMKKDVHDIKELLSEAKGGWKVVLLLSSVAGAVGAGIAWFVSVWFHK